MYMLYIQLNLQKRDGLANLSLTCEYIDNVHLPRHRVIAKTDIRVITFTCYGTMNSNT